MELVQIYLKILIKLQFLPVKKSLHFSVIFQFFPPGSGSTALLGPISFCYVFYLTIFYLDGPDEADLVVLVSACALRYPVLE